MFETVALIKTSKQNKEYVCLEVTFPNGYKKIVFLDKAEEYLLQEYAIKE